MHNIFNKTIIVISVFGLLFGFASVVLISQLKIKAQEVRPLLQTSGEWKRQVYRDKYKAVVQKQLQDSKKKETAPKIAKVTAYSCGGLNTEAEIKMNCPSLKKYPKGRTATGTTPRPYITAACDRSNIGKVFHIDGIGRVVCEDTGGAIKGAGRFDIYVTTVHEARKFGVQKVAYKEINE